MTLPLRLLCLASALALAACGSEPVQTPAVASPEGVEPGQTLSTPDPVSPEPISPDAGSVTDSDDALEQTPLNPGVTEPRSQTPAGAESSSPGS